MHSISLPPSDKNIKVVRKFAREKELSLRKVPNEELWSLKDPYTGEYLQKSKTLMEIHDYLCHYDD